MTGLIFWDPDRARHKHLTSRRHDTSAGDMIELDLLDRQRPHEFMEARYFEAHQDGATILQRRHGDGRGDPPGTTDLSSERIVRHPPRVGSGGWPEPKGRSAEADCIFDCCVRLCKHCRAGLLPTNGVPEDICWTCHVYGPQPPGPGGFSIESS